MFDVYVDYLSILDMVKVDEKGWRVILSYLEMSQHDGKLTNPTKLPGSSDDPRSCRFDPKIHKSLNSELKYLYTAVTRAKCNLWIYDSDRKTRLPMFDYWHKRDLVKVVQAQPSAGSQDAYTLVFASNSTPEQWKAQGDNFKKKHLWEQAILCYQHAGPENEYLAKEACAYHLIQRARHQKPQLYLEAALNFLECDSLHHSLHYINGAALCLRNSKPPKYIEAAKLFDRLGEVEKAVQSYLKGRDIDNYVRLKEGAGQHGDVVRTLMGKPFMRKRDALAKASEYERQGIELHQDLSTSELSYSCARFYSKRGDNDSLIEVLSYMPEVSRKVKFLKEARLYDKVFETLVEKKELKDAYRFASARGGCKHGLDDSDKSWLQRGLTTAENNKDEAMRASFVFQIAKVEYKQLQAKNQLDKVSSDVVKNLDSLLRNKDQLIKAQAYLLLGMLKKDLSLCRTAWRCYHLINHKVGELEAFNQMQKLASEPNQSLLLDVCHVAKETGDTLMKASDINKVVKEALSFYGLQRIGIYYYTPLGQDIWIGEPLMKCESKTSKHDLDGMIKLEASEARDELAKHCLKFKDCWLSYSELKMKLEQKLMTFHLHDQLWKEHHLKREYSMAEVSGEALRNYLQTSVQLLELFSLREERTGRLIASLVSMFAPNVYIYLSQRIEGSHIAVVRRSVNSHNKFRLYIKHTSFISDSSDHLNVDSWLRAWRASCVSEPDMKLLFSMLQDLEKEVNDKSVTVHPERKHQPLPGFIYWRNDKKFYHIFSLWLNSCVEIREKGKFLWASKLAIFYFLGTIAKQPREYGIKVMSVVDILSIHCTGLLAMLTHINALQNVSISCTIPLFYKSSVHLFDLMNSWKREDHWLLSACAKEVHSGRDLRTECNRVLIGALDLILGTNPRAPHYSVLRFGLKNIASTDATKQCLILALVLFGNLSMFCVYETSPYFHQKMHDFYQKIQLLLKWSMNIEEQTPEYISMAYKTMMNPNFSKPTEVFKLVEQLLQDAKVGSTLAQLVFKAKGHHGKVEIHPHLQKQATRSQTTPPLQVPVPPPPGLTPRHQLTSRLAESSLTDQVSDPIQPSNVTIPYPSVPTFPGCSAVLDVPFTAAPQKSSGVQQFAGHAPSSLTDVPFMGDLTPSSAAMQNPSSSEKHHQNAQQLEEVLRCSEAKWKPPQLDSDGDFHEQEEDTSIALTGGAIGQWLQINPELVDPEMVTHTFCNVCGVPLKADHVFSGSEEQSLEVVDSMPNELYHVHVFTELHQSNISLYKQFTTIISNESETELYPNLKRDLTDLLQNFRALKNHYDTDKLDRPIDDIQEELDKNDIMISELEGSRKWREVINEISRMVDSMDRLLKKYSELYSQVSEDLKQYSGTKVEDVTFEVDAEEYMEKEIDSLSERFDPTDVPVTATSVRGVSETKKLRSEEDKLKSRQKKKEKQWLLGRSGD